jgi:hypothetical protein
MGVVSLYDVLAAFQVPELPTKGEADALILTSLLSLVKRQLGNGGFTMYPTSCPDPTPSPYVSLHCGLALALARERELCVGPVLSAACQQAVAFSRHLDDVLDATAAYLQPQSRRSLQALAAYVLARFGEPDASDRAVTLLAQHALDDFSLESLGWLLAALGGRHVDHARAIATLLLNSVSETAGAAHFTTSYGDDGAAVLLHSARRTDAVVLDGLLRGGSELVAATEDLAGKLARGLLAHRVAGRWANTQENALCLAALHTFAEGGGDAVGVVWLTNVVL